MRILVTNDDGVSAPGLGALTRTMAQRLGHGGPVSGTSNGPPVGTPDQIVVVAPSSNFSGAGAAVGHVTDRMTIPYQRATIAGAEHVPAFGLAASPALSVIAGALGAMGPRPDLVLSGINHGVNVGRSVLHSGTVGAALDRRTARHQRTRGVTALGGRPRPVGRCRRAGGRARCPFSLRLPRAPS